MTTGREKAGWSEEAELNGVEEERDGMSDEEGNEIDGEEEFGSARLASESRTQKQARLKGRERGA